jgi:hypothetical protein
LIVKFIGNEAQRKIDLQIRTQQEKIITLENQLSISKNEMSSFVKTWQKEKLEFEQTKATQIESVLQQANAERLVALQLAERESNHQIAKLNLQIDTLQTSVLNFQQRLEKEITENSTFNIQLEEANTKLAECQSQLAVLLTNFTDINCKLTEAEAKDNIQTKELETVQTELAAAHIKTEGISSENASNLKALQSAKEQVDRLKSANLEAEQKIQSLYASLADESKALHIANNTLAGLKAQQDSQASELISIKNTSAQLEKNLSAANLSKVEAENAIQYLKAELDNQLKLTQQIEAKCQDITQENELLFLQLMQSQEEMGEYYQQKNEFEKLCLAYKARWDRLEKRFPNYLDFGIIEIEQVDGLSDVPSVTWKVENFVQAGIALPKFRFQTILQGGNPGIGLIQSDIAETFVPKLLATDKAHRATFMGIGSMAFEQIKAAVGILGQLEAAQWKGFEFPLQFDIGFWRPSLKALIVQIQSLPSVLRYDQVKLKRELINPDYEHLWLEFQGLQLDAKHWEKFEIRMGAALVQTDGFSQYPKFEIPLIDGKTKPFESWYPESNDESGAKLELRFALDKQVFDVAVWAKLSEADRSMLLNLIYAMPEALKRLEAQRVAIHRPWNTWVKFALGSVQVLQASKLALAKTVEPVDNLKPAVSIPPVATPLSGGYQPNKLDETQLPLVKVPKAGRLINVTSKPSADRKAMKAKS